MIKICTKCKEEKDIQFFHKDSQKKDGYYSSCKSCNVRKQYFDSRKNQKREYDQRYYVCNKDHVIARMEGYNLENRDINNARMVKRSKTDLNFKMKSTLRKRIVKIVKGHTKGGSAVRDLGCTVSFFIQYIESLFETTMSWDNYGVGRGRWQLDHVEPLCSFDLSNREQFLKACNYKNMQPMWHENHVIKSVNDRKRSIHAHT